MHQIAAAQLPADAEHVQDLLLEYAKTLPHDADLCIQSLDQEIAGLFEPAPVGGKGGGPAGAGGMYQQPGGFLLAIADDGRIAGGVGFRSLEADGHPGVAELRRLFVRPEFRGQHLGRWLAMAAIFEATQAGYRRMRLETTPGMAAAQALYESMGFHDVTVPVAAGKSVRTMELDLDPVHAARP